MVQKRQSALSPLCERVLIVRDAIQAFLNFASENGTATGKVKSPTCSSTTLRLGTIELKNTQHKGESEDFADRFTFDFRALGL